MYIAIAVVAVAIAIGLFLLTRRAAPPTLGGDTKTTEPPKLPAAPPARREGSAADAAAAPRHAPAQAGPPAAEPKLPATRDVGTKDVAVVGAPAAIPAVPGTAETNKAAAPAAEPVLEGSVSRAAPGAVDDDARRRDVETLKKALSSTRDGFVTRLARLFGRHKQIDTGLLDEIEAILLTADVGVPTTERILEQLRARMRDGALADEDAVWACLRDEAVRILDVPSREAHAPQSPMVILVIGVNGVGKTTTIGKLASRYAAQGKKVLLAAGDTYRAAAALQLEVWGRRVSCPIVKGKENADPGSVIYDAVRRARDEGFDLVIADTAGRLHTKTPLMEELAKVERTCAKALDGRAPDEILLVLDSTTGQNAVQQANTFREAMRVTGIVLTKLDGTAKGGVVLGVVHQHGIPVRYVGVGERVEDLREFDARAFVEALFAKDEPETEAA